MKKLTWIILIVGLLAGIVGVVGAQDVSQNRPGGRDGFGNDGGRGRHGRMHPDRGEALRELAQIVVDETGLTTEEISQLVQDGATLTEVIAQNGGSVENVTSQATTAITQRIQSAVEAGTLTQERADEMLVNLEQRITDALNGEWSGRGLPRLGKRVIVSVAEEVASAIGLTLDEIRTQVEAGATFETILVENDVDMETFSADVIAKASELLNAQVSEGTITQEQADLRLAAFTEHLPEILTRTFEARREQSTGGSI